MKKEIMVMGSFKKTFVVILLMSLVLTLFMSAFSINEVSGRLVKQVTRNNPIIISIEGWDQIDNYNQLTEYMNSLKKLFEKYENDERISLIDYSLVRKQFFDNYGNIGLGRSLTFLTYDPEVYIGNYGIGYMRMENITIPGKLDAESWYDINQKGILNLVGITTPEFYQYRQQDIEMITHGGSRMITEKEIDDGEWVCMVPAALKHYEYFNYDSLYYGETFPDGTKSVGFDLSKAREKMVKPGDTITLTTFFLNEDSEVAFSKQYQLKVVGRYLDVTIPTGPLTIINGIFVPMSVLEKLQEDDIFYSKQYDSTVYTRQWGTGSKNYPNTPEGIHYHDYYENKKLKVNYAIIEVVGEEYVEEIKREIKDQLNNGKLKFVVQSNEYDTVAGALTSMKDYSVGLLIFLSITSVILMVLIINMMIQSRRQELGILFALGRSRVGLLLLISRNVLAMITVSTVIAVTIALTVREQLLDTVMMSYLSTASQQEEAIMTDIVNASGSKELLLPVMMIYLMALTACLVSTILIMRLSPKKILLQQE